MLILLIYPSGWHSMHLIFPIALKYFHKTYPHFFYFIKHIISGWYILLRSLRWWIVREYPKPWQFLEIKLIVLVWLFQDNHHYSCHCSLFLHSSYVVSVFSHSFLSFQSLTFVPFSGVFLLLCFPVGFPLLFFILFPWAQSSSFSVFIFRDIFVNIWSRLVIFQDRF